MGTLAAVGAMVGAGGVVAPPWSPLALFAESEQGVWYDPSDFSTMFQDSAGTIPVTATTQPVGKILDKSGNNNHATQATADNRPTLEVDGSGKYYLAFSGTKHLLTSAINMGGNQMTVLAGFARTSATGVGENNPIFQFGTTAQTGSLSFLYYVNALLYYRRGSSTFGGVSTSATYSNGINATSAIVDFTGNSHVTEMPKLRNFSQDLAFGTTYGVANAGNGPFGNYALYVGRSGTNYLSGKLYGLILRAANSTLAELEDAEDYVCTKSGVTGLPYKSTPTTWNESRATIDQTNYIETSAFAHVEYVTAATVLEIHGYTDLYGTYPGYTDIGVYVDGVWHDDVQLLPNGSSYGYVTLSAGTKTVRIVNGIQSKPSALSGAWFVRVRANAALTETPKTATNRLLIYGDSISVGSFGSPVTQNAWATLVRAAAEPDSVAVEGWGFRSLYDDAANGTLRAAFVSVMAAYAPSKIWLAIGTNDYGLNRWAAAAFGTAYAAFLDDLHAALPSATIYCQTPILRTTETANGSGSTLGDYRTQIGTAQSTRSAYATLVDGTAFMTTASLTDGVHPSTAGHALYATAVTTALGL